MCLDNHLHGFAVPRFVHRTPHCLSDVALCIATVEHGMQYPAQNIHRN
ncbi:hypothetical protein APHCRT_1046 [Anaplasma phagocytophilum str. CRT53-1]|uniref:Uncharacterized protein n=1 Tax=Anaplasma phagocytophilum str. CRT53-1 TaxID=1359157 RepID=A0A0F3PXL2_ANAPH|nr:hypothetical protein APHCRT_1046 [Anaplasma phagocytophilum str. CRT53-1]